MLLAHIRAGVGNRLFQYASVKGLARRQGFDMRVASLEFDHEHGDHHQWFLEAIQKNCDFSLRPRMMYMQPDQDHVGVPTTQTFEDMTLLHGYYQFEENFSHIADELRLEFSESERVSKKLDTFGLDWSKCWAVHIRLGDYLRNQKHFVNLTKYYLECLGEIPKDATVLIICEDHANIPRVYPMVHEELQKRTLFQIPIGSDELDLYALSRCSGVICSNSTFAWWGAWLGRPKKVYLPNKWFRDDSRHVPMKGAVLKEV